VTFNSIGLLNMKKKGFNVILIRDLTDSAVDYRSLNVSKQETEEIVIDYIEKYLVPTTLSEELY
ncbi:isochorismatase, partial [Candidatus Woesearchaeota archaeon]|nr:isochorismatase [Candidatus Woesearchaeota archaeon]